MARVSIEDCLQTVENRFALVKVAVDRTRSLMDGATPLVKSRNKEGVTALREIADGFITGRQQGSTTASVTHLTPNSLSTSNLTQNK